MDDVSTYRLNSTITQNTNTTHDTVYHTMLHKKLTKIVEEYMSNILNKNTNNYYAYESKYLPMNHLLTSQFIENHTNENWNFSGLSMNPNITMNIVIINNI